MRSYTELVTHLYSQENLAKIEWAVGSALADGPNKKLVICGPAASGKSTMLHIVKAIFDRDGYPDNVETRHDGFPEKYGDNRIQKFTAEKLPPTRWFIASNRPVRTKSTDMIVATPTGNRHSHLTYRRLMDEVMVEIDEISNACLDRYLEVGPRHYEDLTINNCLNQENNQ